MGIPSVLYPIDQVAVQRQDTSVGGLFTPHDVFVFNRRRVTARNVIVKHPLERFPIGMDFSTDLGPGEAIVLIGTITDSHSLSGAGAVSEAITDIQNGGTQVAWWISGGTHADDVRVQVAAILNNGDQRVLDGIVKVRQ